MMQVLRMEAYYPVALLGGFLTMGPQVAPSDIGQGVSAASAPVAATSDFL
eukprot:CAMPEP_0172694590 /NCGR_PEP_ID=MMETSP1074-20121228/26770_1 /TAXON_ID=2916 /ORGANISM="Ceratium fusus, Strain PA161109" /LENGTH=49 /DNA_ID=CAMNT_0013515099 /DNA_START=105 /DNA_END=254 /DNA_ORIENTATION=-